MQCYSPSCKLLQACYSPACRNRNATQFIPMAPLMSEDLLKFSENMVDCFCRCCSQSTLPFRVRSSPDVHAPIVAYLHQKQQFEVIGATSGDWLEIRAKPAWRAKRCWVRRSVLDSSRISHEVVSPVRNQGFLKIFKAVLVILIVSNFVNRFASESSDAVAIL
jgi:hypothetical protein